MDERPEWLEQTWKVSEETGNSTMSFEEIDAVIAEARREQKAKPFVDDTRD